MRTTYFALALGALASGACSLPNEPNLNGPSVTDYTTISTLAQVQTLVTGVLRGDRIVGEQQIYFGEIVGRDAYIITASEFRYETELLGPPPGIDPGGFIGARMWPYATIRLANIGFHGVSAAPASVLGAADKASTLGYLQTIKALVYLRIVEMRDTSGAPVNVDVDPLAPLTPLSCKHDVLNYIAALLDSGATNLTAGGATFPFALPPGFAGFDAPATFRTFNRGLAAKVQVYLAFRNYATPAGVITGTIDAAALGAANTALAASFLVQDSTQLDLGPAHTYTTNTGDATNTLFDTDTSGTTYLANPRVRSEADAGDDRVARKTAISSQRTVAGASSNIVFTLYLSPTTPTKILTNKELLLLRAEVNWGLNNYATALAQAQYIRRNDGKLLTDTTTAAAAGVLNRILYEKRYSLLWQSADRFADARQFGKLNGTNPPTGVGLERTYPPVYAWPLPFAEQNARNGDLSRQCTAGP